MRTLFCDALDCARKIFPERRLAFVEPWARVTIYLHQALEVAGIAAGGEVGMHLDARRALPTSPTTLLHRVMALPTDPTGSVKLRSTCGKSYGTVLVN
ncbi:MAG TPA: hypothetical protein VGF67_01125 [Ktedonobacteraceae bacterium]|jgi:hypothetical protein